MKYAESIPITQNLNKKFSSQVLKWVKNYPNRQLGWAQIIQISSAKNIWLTDETTYPEISWIGFSNSVILFCLLFISCEDNGLRQEQKTVFDDLKQNRKLT